MANTLRALSVDLKALAVALPENASSLAKATANAISNDLIQVTPVDTGAAMSNWQMTLDSPAEEPIEAFVPSPRGKMVRGKWTHSVDPDITAQANAPFAQAAAEIVVEKKEPGQEIFITNTLPYIQALDQGHSQQTPAGFVDRALALTDVLLADANVTN